MRMKYRGKWMVLFLAAVLPALVAPLGATDVFKARMFTGRAPVEPSVVSIRIEIESWTTPGEIRQLQDVLNQTGVEAMLNTFNGMKKGVVRFMYARGWNLPIHTAQVVPTEKGKKIVLMLNRQGWDPGAAQTGSRHYFMCIELNLNEKGKGEGRFYEDAQMELDSTLGTIKLGAYDGAPRILPQVQEVIKKTPGS